MYAADELAEMSECIEFNKQDDIAQETEVQGCHLWYHGAARSAQAALMLVAPESRRLLGGAHLPRVVGHLNGFVGYPNAMRKLLQLLLLSSPVMVTAQQTSAPMPDVIATYPVELHEQLSPSCELIEPVTLIQYKQYDALELAGSTDEIYSPELTKGDFVALSTAVPKTVGKSAKKSGFDMRAESAGPSGPSTKTVTKGSCPDAEQAIAEANNLRHHRRLELQAHIHRVGFNVLPPVAIQQVQPEPVSHGAAQSSGQVKAKEGTIFLAMEVGVDGRVHDVQVLRSLDVVLDQKAFEAVRQWKFSPARMNGLPVPVQIQGEVEFRLH